MQLLRIEVQFSSYRWLFLLDRVRIMVIVSGVVFQSLNLIIDTLDE